MHTVWKMEICFYVYLKIRTKYANINLHILCRIYFAYVMHTLCTTKKLLKKRYLKIRTTYAKIVCIFYAYSMQICIAYFVHTLCIIESNEKRDIWKHAQSMQIFICIFAAVSICILCAYFVHNLCNLFIWFLKLCTKYATQNIKILNYKLHVLR